MSRPRPRFKARISAVLVTVLMCVLAYASGPAPTIDAVAIEKQYEIFAAKPLWPNFQPSQIPLAIFDGVRTWLFRHPSPPTEFGALPDLPGAFSAPGRYAAVTANTSAEIGGVLTAVASGIKPAPVTRQAALMMHEAFHVYQRQHHPDWSANEADFFLYPLDRAEALQLRRLESEALHRALDASGEECRCWARSALDMRAGRFSQLPSHAVEYERRTELNEGLAQYVEDQAAGQTRADLLPTSEFAADNIRLRAYSSGEAIALLLDRFNPPPEATQQNPRRFFGNWRDELDSSRGRFLDQILERRLAGTKACEFYVPEKRAALQRAQNDVDQLQRQREQALRDFHALPGWRVVIEAKDAGFQSQGFDPLNVTLVGNGLVLHRRYLKAGGNGATLEMVEGRALTEAAGTHPMFSGIRRVTIAGLTAAPSLNERDGGVSLNAAGLKADFPKASASIDAAAKQITISF